jgi:hypothetical protein
MNANVTALLRSGLTGSPQDRRELFADGAVAAAERADELGVLPQSLAYLAEVVRAGGAGFAADLPEPLPGRGAALAVEWLRAVPAVPGSTAPDDLAARWLDAVAAVLDFRRRTRAEAGPTAAGGKP